MARSDNGAGNGSGKGRPRLKFDLEQVKRSGELRESKCALARRLGCTSRTVHKRWADDEAFVRAYEEGAADRESTLRETAFRLAIGSKAEYVDGELVQAEWKPNIKILIRLLECELGYVPRKHIEIERTLPEDPDKMTRAEAEAFLEEELGTTLEERMRPPSVH